MMSSQISGGVPAQDFSLRYTAESAQPLTFMADFGSNGRSLSYPYKNSLIRVEHMSKMLAYSAVGEINERELKKEVIRRFGLEDNIERIYEEISTDEYLRESIKSYRGMRVTKNELWETTLCFLISQFNNVKRIRKTVRTLMETYGEQNDIEIDSKLVRFNSFPEPEVLAKLDIKELMKCGVGFRARYIKGASQLCSESFDLERLQNKSYSEAKEQLMELPGVGDKVADCILLMGYKKGEAFPIDTWIKRVVEKIYFNGKKQSVKQIHTFADERWGMYAGYAQQYLFHSARINKLDKVVE